MNNTRIQTPTTTMIIISMPTLRILFLATCAGCLAVNSAAPQSPPWDEIRKLASDFVTHESPPKVLPFETSRRSSNRKVFIHYFPFWVLSLDNKPVQSDFWSANYRSVLGGQGKYVKEGGLFRERPITPLPWASPYWRQRNLAIDILRAQRINADGFLLDLPGINEGRAWEIATSLCEVASHVAPGFHIALEPGMAALRSSVDPATLAQALLTLNQCPAAFHLPDGRLLVAPFAPELEPPTFWGEVIKQMTTAGVKTAFLPVFLAPGKYAQSFRSLSYGISHWGVGDVDGLDSLPQKGLSSTYSVFMEPVRPQDVRPNSRSFWEAQNTTLYRRMWTRAIQGSAQYVQVITWNDLSEGTEIEPASATQFLFFDLSAYFIDWYKTGAAPKIQSDAIYYSSRDQIIIPGQAPNSEQLPMQLRGNTPVTNNIEMLAFLTAPSLLEISIGNHIYKRKADAGMAVFSVPASYGQPMFRIIRADAVVAETTAHYVISQNRMRENPLYYGGSSNRNIIQFPISSESK